MDAQNGINQPEKSTGKSASYHHLRRSIILDKVDPKDLRELNIAFACEQCSYYSSNSKRCAMGFKVEQHLMENQMKLYNLTGRMAICRAQEID